MAVPSLPLTVKWQNPGVAPAVTAIAPGWLGVIEGDVRVIVPLQAGVPAKASNAAWLRVTLALPDVISGCSVMPPPDGTITTSGLRSQSDAGVVTREPVRT